MDEKKSAQETENVTKEIFQMACVGTLAGFSLASFEGYFLPPVLATATRAAMKEALGTFRRYGVLGAAMFAGYAITEEVVVSVKGSRDWWAPFAAGSVVGLGASAVAKNPAWTAIVISLTCGIGAALAEGPVRDHMLYHQAKWVQLQDQEEINHRQRLFYAKNLQENSRRLIEVEREALQALRE